MSTLKHLRTLAEYQRERAEFFPSLDSARWAIRRHRSELVKAKALVNVADRLFVDPELADGVFLEAGRRRCGSEA